MTPPELQLLGKYIVVRTERGDGIIKLDPRQMPRRLRVLLLAIDGGQPVQLYTQMLKGFGDVSELLVELVNLGMVRLLEPSAAKKHAASLRSSNGFDALHHLLDDSRFDTQSAADVLYGSTTPGSFDDMVRVARIDKPDFQPAETPPPAPVAAPAQKAQIESLFNMLDSVRGERKLLKQQVAKLHRIKETAQQLHKKNKRLEQWNLGLAVACALLTVSFLVVLARH